MKKNEKNALLKWAQGLTDEDLEKEYYDAVLDSFGSDTDKMYELGYDMRDIEERKKHEKYLAEKSHVLEELCDKRGINCGSWEVIRNDRNN